MTMNDSWGYQHADTNYKTPFMLLRTFVDCLSMGGNLLLDIGPKEDGTIPAEQIAVLKEFGRWTKSIKKLSTKHVPASRANIFRDIPH